MKQVKQKSTLALWKWGNDIYDTGYRIFTIAYSRKFGFDCYLFCYPTGSYIPKHKDPSKYGAQYRLNFELIKATKGGQFKCNNIIFSLFNRIYLFRADTEYHSVTTVEEGKRVVLSFGKFLK